MENKLKDLINKLRELKGLVKDHPEILEMYAPDGFLSFDKDHVDLTSEEVAQIEDVGVRKAATIYYEILLLADEVLISTSGHCNWRAHEH